MEQSGDPTKIKHTIKSYETELNSAFSGYAVLSGPQSDFRSSLHHDYQEEARPIIEVVTVIDAVDLRATTGSAATPSEVQEGATRANVKERYLILHSEVLSQTIRDVVKLYPGQVLSGSSLVIHQPYSCLLHHFSDLEHEVESTEASIKFQHLETLLQFLRPLYQKCYVSARNRVSMAQPTVRFEDIWVLMKPGTLAYTKWDGQWLGCVVGQSKLVSATDKLPEAWLITYWILQVHCPSDQIRSAKNSTVIQTYDGEELVTSLSIIPAEIQDAQDLGERRKQLTERGQKTCKLIWGDSMYVFYEGVSLNNDRHQVSEQVVVWGENWYTQSSDDHRWVFNWGPLNANAALNPNDPLLPAQEAINRTRKPTTQQCLIISPCLSAWATARSLFFMANVENIKYLDIPTNIPDPILSNQKLPTLMKMVDFQACSKGGARVILLHGPPGAGKSYTIESISRKTRRPIIPIGDYLGVSGNSPSLKKEINRWFSIAERWNGILLIDNCDLIFSAASWNSWSELKVSSLKRALKSFDCLLFLTTTKCVVLHDSIHSSVDLAIHVEQFDDERRSKVWDTLKEDFQQKDDTIVLSRSATELLHTSKTQIEWDGHEMNRCFKTAIALATAQAKQGSGAGSSKITVSDENFKEAMNIAHEWRQHVLDKKRGRAGGPMPVGRPTGPPPYQSQGLKSPPSSSSGYSDDEDERRGPGETGRRRMKWTPRTNVNPDYDPNLCIPSLNCLEWDAFQAAGNKKELFRKTKYYAVDVLVGEPCIRLKPDNKARRKRKALSQRSADINTPGPHGVPEKILDKKTAVSGEESLPERIRINSSVLAEVFSEITEDDLGPPFLLFRPFRFLIYYEQDLRNWAAQQEESLKELESYVVQERVDDNPVQPDDERKRILTRLEEMRCLLSFIDNYIKIKQAYLSSHRCVSVAFADLALLFNPGDIVVTHDLKQAFRVTKVSSERHRVKSRDEDDLDLWKDETEVEYDENPVFVHCTHVDYDGTMIGPVSHIKSFVRFDGRMAVSSLSIYPLRHTKDAELRKRLIERGKTFLKLAAIKHMHYTGLTLETRDEIDSQVVIDFNETFTRFSTWKPCVRHAADEWMLKDALDRPDYPRRHYNPEDEWIFYYKKARESQNLPCIDECCDTETHCPDADVESKRMKDYIVAQMTEKGSAATPVSIIPTAFKDIDEPLADEDYIVMSYRVYGFVLRSRKWHQLDMTYISEVAILGEGEGFDQLVLPPGHGSMVKSMIRQHLRDRKLASANRDKPDVVRGKGRGLIMLLHGVPGVGKTSTAECVADSFRRPLFQITSGDLGTTAREVEDALEQNFNLASRWDCILLIDEADVFLGERSKEDFVRNSLVAVFLRMMEYYAGVLFLTTNRVGVFDEAFTSRVHISLYYPPLDRDATLQIFTKNWDRIRSRYRKNNKEVDVRESEIKEFANDYFDNNKDGRWNGRQIRNAFQSALALAELDALGTDDLLDETDHGRTVVLGKKSFEIVADAYKGFLNYLKQVYGADAARRARENLWRYDAFGLPKIPNALTTRLKMADPGPSRAPPGPQQPWPPAGPPPQAGYGYGDPQASSSSYYQSQPPPPPQQPYYQGRWDYQDQRPRHMPAPDPYEQPPPPQERFRDPYGRGAEGYGAGSERPPQTPEQQYRRGGAREYGFAGREADDPR